MANVELITCDYAGCNKPFAYRIKGFNLCAEHCFDDDSWLRIIRTELARKLDTPKKE
jgi:hypothetical protein